MKLHKLKPILFIAIGVLVFSSAASADADTEKPTAKEEVHAAAIAFNTAYGANELEKYFAFYTDDATLLTPAGTIQPVAEYYEEWKAFLESGGGVAKIHSLEPTSIRTSPDGTKAIVVYAPSTVDYVSAGGEESSSKFAETDIWSKIDGQWKVVHIHYHDLD